MLYIKPETIKQVFLIFNYETNTADRQIISYVKLNS